MLFSSLFFLQIFFPAVFLIAVLLKNRSNLFLLLASLLFYAWGEPYFITVLLFSITVNYFLGRWIEDADRDIGHRASAAGLFAGITLNLLILGYFKYATFFIENLKVFLPSVKVDDIPMPIGISFFTFQAISYLVDVYKKQTKCERNPISLGLYIAFFPQLIAGPIIKYHDIADQLHHRRITWEETAYGMKRFILGLAKKVIIANELALVADSSFNTVNGLSLSAAWLGAFAYTMQIYYDFSGYSDMAIGLGRMFGFRYAENFDCPYLSCSIREFWKRWHISLSTWFKEYLYIPLGGNRHGQLCTIRNLALVFLATGLWHGAHWNFVFWGALHGFFVILEHLLSRFRFPRIKPLCFFYTIITVIFSWVFFRAGSIQEGFLYIGKMLIPGTDWSAVYFQWVSPYYIALYCISAILCGPIRCFPPVRKYLSEGKTCLWDIILLPVILGYCIIRSGSDSYNPFIYFRF